MDASLPQKYPWICWHLYKIRTCIETTNPGLVTNLVTHLLGVDRGMEAEASPWTQFYTFSESVRIFWPLFTSQNLGESFLCWPARVTFTSTDPPTGNAGQPHVCPPPRALGPTEHGRSSRGGQSCTRVRESCFSFVCFLYYSLTMYFFWFLLNSLS